MNNTVKSILKFLVFLSVGILLIWLSIRNIDDASRANMLDTFKNAKVHWLFLSALLGILSHFSRAIRWNMLIETFMKPPRVANSFFAVMAGYLVNLAIPRLGEITRAGLINRYEQVPLDKAIGTIISERAIDVLCLLVVLILTFTTQFNIIGTYVINNIFIPIKNKLVSAFEGNILILLGAIVGLILLGLLGLFIVRKLQGKLKTVIMSIWEGVISVKNVKNVPLFIAHTAFIWSMYLLMSYICIFSIDATSGLGIGAGLAILAFGSFGVIVAPGGLGAYPAITGILLTLYNVSYEMGVVFGWATWSAQTVMVLIVGGISMALLPIFNKNGQINDNSTKDTDSTLLSE